MRRTNRRIETVFVTQYEVSLQTLERKFQWEPEKKLMLAVLEDAMACFQKYVFARDPKRKMLFQETDYWIHDTNSDWTFSFAHVCETLGFNPDYLQRGLAHWKAAKLESRAKAKIYRLAQGTARAREAFP